MIIPYKIDVKTVRPGLLKNLKKLGNKSFLVTDYPDRYHLDDQSQILDINIVIELFIYSKLHDRYQQNSKVFCYSNNRHQMELFLFF